MIFTSNLDKGVALKRFLDYAHFKPTRIVFIDDKSYSIGDVVSDAEILDIAKQGVYFMYHGKRMLMRLKK